MSNQGCPKCSGLVVFFTDMDKNDGAAMGRKCRSCDWRETLGDLLAEVQRLRTENAELVAASRSLPTSIIEALNSGDGTYKP